MRIGVVSDTHGHVQHAQQAARLLESLQVDLLLHCGDIGSADIPPIFARWPTHYVFGNCDYDQAELATAIAAAGQTLHGLAGELDLAGARIAFLHGHDQKRMQQTIAAGRAALVCYGHTHVAEQHLVGNTWVLNPGALYRANPHTFAIVDLPQMTITSIAL
jgi:putative phosphoesterase